MRLTTQMFFSIDRLATRLVAVVLLLATAELAIAAVNFTGDVKPTGTSFGTIFTDDDGDNISDVIDDQGNNVFDFLADPTDPDAASGTNGLAWNDPLIWVDYESRQNILVGETGSGHLEINGASALRYQHLVLGGVSDDFTGGDLDLTAAAASNDFDFNADLNSAMLPTAGFGQVTVTGFGSVYNNDPDVVPSEFITALTATSAITDTQAAVTFLEINVVGARQQTPGSEFDVHVGLLGGGALNVEAGGRVEIQDALFIGLGRSANGTVTVTGNGSVLLANGREELDYSNGDSTPTTEYGSIIGGHGTGSLNLAEGGRVEMFNGASLGAANTTTTLSGGVATEAGSGIVTLSGIGTTWNVYASSAVHDGNGTSIALAVGDLTNDSNDAVGSGLIQVGTGSTVNVTFSASYAGNNADEAKMVIGSNGTVDMQGGALRVVDSLTNDGNLAGYGSVTSGKFYNGSGGSLVVSNGEQLSIRSNIDTATDTVVGFDASSTAISPAFPAATSFGIQTDSTGNGVVDTDLATFYQGNLGSILVESGGELELGRSQPVDPVAAVDREEAFQNARFVSYDDSNLFFDNGGVLDGVGTQIGEHVTGTITSTGGTIHFKSGLYNTGILALTGGDSTIVGKVLNGSIDYDDATDTVVTVGPNSGTNHQLIVPGVVLVSGNQTTATFTDDVDNQGIISIGPDDNVVNFLGGLTNSGTIKIASNLAGFGISESAAIVVAQDVTILGGTVNFAFATGAASASAGFSASLLTAGGELAPDSLFTELDLPTLDAGLYWDVIYDTINDEVRLEIVESAAFGADFNGDGVVNTADLGIWNLNSGITSGASIIQGDADLDGDVDLGDYLLLSQQMFDGVPIAFGGGGGGGSPIPEPATLLLALLATIPLAGRNRAKAHHLP